MNTKKTLAIFMCMLMLAVIPASLAAVAKEANATKETEKDPQTTDVGRTMLRGFYFMLRPSGRGNHFIALRVHYTEVTGSTTSIGIIRFQRCEVGRWIGGYMRELPMGVFGYMAMATFSGGIQVY